DTIFCFLFSLFFFSSRRRHTRSTRDWSSDVCSSDLLRLEKDLQDAGKHAQPEQRDGELDSEFFRAAREFRRPPADFLGRFRPCRSEERRVGKECSCRWLACVERETVKE